MRFGSRMLCRLLPHALERGSANMACDEALLESVSSAPTTAVFRTYGWECPTLSLGYFQSIADAESDPRFAGHPVVRRATGGGALWHHHELTYALVIPRSHPLGSRPGDLYREVHRAIGEVLSDLGLEIAEFGLVQPGVRRTARLVDRPFLCFRERAPEDLVSQGAKVVGSAQRRRPGSILQHGSILLSQSDTTPELPGLNELAGLNIHVPKLIQSLQRSIVDRLGLEPKQDVLTHGERYLAATLEREVYLSDRWTRKR